MPSMSRSLLLFAALFFIIFNEASVAFSLPVSKIRVHSIHTLYASARVESGIAGNASIDESLQDQCPRGYYLNSAKNQCTPLGPLGQISQLVETSSAPLRKASTAISTLFGIDASKISGLGVGFALSYSILSTLNGAVSLSFAWYLSCRRVSFCSAFTFSCTSMSVFLTVTSCFVLLHRYWSSQTGLSPFAPGQWVRMMESVTIFYLVYDLAFLLGIPCPHFLLLLFCTEISGGGLWNNICHNSVFATLSCSRCYCHVEAIS